MAEVSSSLRGARGGPVSGASQCNPRVPPTHSIRYLLLLYRTIVPRFRGFYKLAAVREELLAQAAKDREALEAELGARHEGEREKLMEEARERADEMVKEVRVCCVAEGGGCFVWRVSSVVRTVPPHANDC